jgi:hypothetical protein
MVMSEVDEMRRRTEAGDGVPLHDPHDPSSVTLRYVVEEGAARSC